ncbi:hypothetical protein [Paenibacillus turpanensis]|uniref:hypothetical protein n=1 Tax=Paenibacillus turpanensis TaxID=2689078 RepID=UPI001409E591|nr:hypothetical protein [Paenibacillus turpanensis]
MKEARQTYRSGERAPNSGTFETVTGRKMQYRQGELFQACPDTGKETDWKHCDA